MADYDKGDVLRVTGVYANAAGTPIDPSVVKFSFKDPAGTITTYTYPTDVQLVRLSQGTFYADVHFTASGWWWCRHWSTGTGEASEERLYKVKQSAF